MIPVKFSNIYSLRIIKYSWCLNNIGFSCAVHWDTDYFSVQTTVLDHPHLAKSADEEPWLWGDNFKVIYQFVIVRRVCTLSPHVIQRSAILLRKIREDLNKWEKTSCSQIKNHKVRHRFGLNIPQNSPQIVKWITIILK